MQDQSVWTLRETLIVAVLGAVFGVLYLGWVQVWLVLQAIFGRTNGEKQAENDCRFCEPV